MRFAAALCFVFVTLLAMPDAALAQDDAARAAQLFRSAERAFARSDYLDALRLFREAYEASPHPTVRFHIAMSLERLGRLRESWTELTEVAATAGLTDAQRRDAERQVARVRAMLVTVRVEGEPPGASVQLDGVPVCTLPCALAVDPGDHELSVEDARGRASSRVAAVRGSELVVRLVIEPPPPQVGAPPPAEALEIAVPAEPAPEIAPTQGVGWLLITGSVIGALGAAGVIGGGVHATEVHDAWLLEPTRARYDEGILFRDLTNASIAVLASGGLMIAIDVVLALFGVGTGERATPQGARF